MQPLYVRHAVQPVDGTQDIGSMHVQPIVVREVAGVVSIPKRVSDALSRPEAEAGRLEQEWDCMCVEWEGICAEYARECDRMLEQRRVLLPPSLSPGHPLPSFAQVQSKYRISIEERIRAGWEREHAVNLVLYTSVYARLAMAAALAQRDERYGASTYALLDALASRVHQPFQSVPCPNDTQPGSDHPGRYYKNLQGANGLILDDMQWHRCLIETALESASHSDFTTHALIRATRESHYFHHGGWRAQTRTNVYTLQEV